jgi:hypothetical protein
MPAEQLVTVCLNYHGDAGLLRQSLQSLRRQSYSRFEVLVRDDSPAGSQSELQRVMQDFLGEGWRCVPGAEAGNGAASAAAEAQARGAYVLFMAAADYLAPEALAVFVKVANSTGAEVLTCFVALFSGVEEPAVERCLGPVPFLGAAAVPGVFRNHFGSGAIFVQRETLLRMGGYPDNARRDCADWEFLARAALTQCRLEVIPAPLLWQRVGDKSDQRISPADYHEQLQALTPYAQAMPPMLCDLPKAAFTMGLHYQRMSERLGNSPLQTMLRRLGANRKGSNLDLADEGALLRTLNQMPSRARDQIAIILDGWLEYSTARSRLPPPGFRRIAHIARQLLRGHYHRYGHGLGSAWRDLRKPVQSRTQKGDN